MVAISQALETAIAVIIFIVLAMMFFSVFGSTECDKLSNTTAIELTNAINKVALEYEVEPWTVGDVPTDDKTDNYVSIPIRLCEENVMNAFAAQFQAEQPTYILTYEIFPEEGFAWSESQPFSGGATESVLNYAVMKYGIQGITLASKFVTKVIKKVGGWVKTAIFKGGFAILGFKFTKFLEKAKENRVIKWILKRFGSSAAQEPIEKNVDDLVNDRYYKEEHKGLIEMFKEMWKGDDISEEKALVELDVYKKGKDGLAFRNPDGKIVVNPEKRDFILNFIENKGEGAEEFAKGLDIPPRFPWLSDPIKRIKANYWQPLKNTIREWWKNSMMKQYLYDKPKALYDKIKGKVQGAKSGFNEIFNYKDGMTDPDILSEKVGIVTSIAKENNEEIRQGMIKNFDNFKDEFEKLYGISSPDEITTEIVDEYISSVSTWLNSEDFVEFSAREIELSEATSLASRKMGSEVRSVANQVKDAIDQRTAYNNFRDSMSKTWDDLLPTDKEKWTSKFFAGYTYNGNSLINVESEAKKAYEYARMSMASEGLFDNMFDSVTGKLRVNQLVTKAERVEREMLSASYKIGPYSTDRIVGFLSTKVLKEPALDKIPRSAKVAGTIFWQRLERTVFLDMNRIGQTPVYSALNVLNSPYSIKEALKKESQIQEGGCASQSICKLQRGKAEGPTETATAYLLDRKVPSNISVKLWRPKPDLWSRTPAGINTILFYNSIWENPRFYVASPCFATAKVWKDKSKNTVFISIDKGNKCDVSGCEQPASYTFDLSVKSLNIPFINVKTPSANLGQVTVGLNSIDTPNYCYADEEFIWGQDLTKGDLLTRGDVPSGIIYYGTFAGLVIGCTAAASSTGGAAFKACLKGAGYATIGILMANVVGATQAYRDVSSSERQETGWGYWNYQKATDICDNIQMISSFGSFKGVGAGKQILPFYPALRETTNIQKIGQTVGKIGKYTGIGLNDLCYAIQLIGDTSLSWPIKTPVGEFWKKATTLDDKCMQESAAECVWLERCDPDPLRADPSLITCPAGYMCDPEEKICKKTGIT